MDASCFSRCLQSTEEGLLDRSELVALLHSKGNRMGPNGRQSVTAVNNFRVRMVFEEFGGQRVTRPEDRHNWRWPPNPTTRSRGASGLLIIYKELLGASTTWPGGVGGGGGHGNPTTPRPRISHRYHQLPFPLLLLRRRRRRRISGHPSPPLNNSSPSSSPTPNSDNESIGRRGQTRRRNYSL